MIARMMLIRLLWQRVLKLKPLTLGQVDALQRQNKLFKGALLIVGLLVLLIGISLVFLKQLVDGLPIQNQYLTPGVILSLAGLTFIGFGVFYKPKKDYTSSKS
jgi:hypothetical protein